MLVKILAIVCILISIALTVIILMQEGKQAGLTGAISGGAETFWGKNKGRSVDGVLDKITKVLVIFFFIIAIVLNIVFK